MMLESWWWPLRASGWGLWRYDFRHAPHGLVLVELQNSFTAHACGNSGRAVCHLYAGLFASVFSHLAHRELAGLEVQCAAAGGDRCRFLVAVPKRIASARPWLDEGVSVEEMVKRLTATAQT